jgi:hypothetical protein
MHVHKEDELLKPSNPMKVKIERNLKLIRIENHILKILSTSIGHNFFVWDQNPEFCHSLEKF